MNARTEYLRRKSQEEIAALRRLEQETLAPGWTGMLGGDRLPLLIACGADPSCPSACWFQLGGDGQVPGLAQHLACGLVASDGRVLHVRRTDRNGAFWLTLSDPGCHLRFVNEIRGGIDVEILVALGDQRAHAQLEAAFDSPALPAELWARIQQALQQATTDEPTDAGQHITRLLVEFRRVNAGRDEPVPVAAPLVRALGERWQNGWYVPATAAAESPATLGAQSGDDGPQPSAVQVRRKPSSGQASPNETVHESSSEYNNGDAPEPTQQDEERWIDLQGDQIVVQVPAELVPYGVVRIVAQVDDQLVGTCLLPLIRYGDPHGEFSIRRKKCLVERVVGGRDPRTVAWYAQPALESTLAWFPAEDVAELLERPEVQDRAELRQRIELLLELVNERERENENDDIEQ